MKRYQCHKIVEAAKVTAAERGPDGVWDCACDDGNVYVVAKHNKVTEENMGYVVRYEDGYQSWSPTKSFEDGYTLIED